MICAGQFLNPAEYPELFRIIGYKYGTRQDHFKIPDYRGYFLRGQERYNTELLKSSQATNRTEQNEIDKDRAKRNQTNVGTIQQDADQRFTGKIDFFKNGNIGKVENGRKIWVDKSGKELPNLGGYEGWFDEEDGAIEFGGITGSLGNISLNTNNSFKAMQASNPHPAWRGFNLDNSRVVRTSHESRPVNISVHYIMRVK